MATAAVTYTFGAGQVAVAADVNKNFDDLVTFLNGQVIQKDGSVAFTGIPSGPALDPSTDNQLARKLYVDTADKARGKFPNVAMAGASGAANLSTTQAILQAGSGNFTTNGSGFGSVVFPQAFAGLQCCVLTGFLVSGPKQVLLSVSAQSVTKVDFFATDQNGAAYLNATLLIHWFAIGY